MQGSKRSLVRPIYPALNGLRGLAIAMVFTSHYGPLIRPGTWTMALWEGVDLFFVLSGFLITGILYDSRDDPHFFRSFYIRRALRIFPLYYGFFLLVAALTPLLHLRYQPILWSNLLYISNLTRIHPEVRNPTVIFFPQMHGGFVLLGVLWSLCVEEQFYLVWPMLLKLLPSRRAMMRFCAAAIVLTPVLRTALWFHDPAKVAASHYLYYVTYTRCDTLFIGCWMALWLRGVRLDSKEVGRIAYPLILLPLLILVVGELTAGRRWTFDEVNPLLCTYGYSLIGLIAAGVLLLALDEESAVFRILRNPRLAALGVISYGFYFFHSMFLDEFKRLDHRLSPNGAMGVGVFVLAFVFTYTLAWLSFRYLESPFLRLKSRLAPGHRSVPSGVEQPSSRPLRTERV